MFRAEEETRKKTEKSNEIKKINTQIMIYRSDIAKMEDTLKEYEAYKKFLDRVTPQVKFIKKDIFISKEEINIVKIFRR